MPRVLLKGARKRFWEGLGKAQRCYDLGFVFKVFVLFFERLFPSALGFKEINFRALGGFRKGPEMK